MRVPDFCAFRPASQLKSTSNDNFLLAARIRDVWARHGHNVRVWVDIATDDCGRLVAYEIRSDLVNGLPRRNV